MDDFRIGDIVTVKGISTWFGTGIIIDVNGNTANIQFQGGTSYVPLKYIAHYDT